MTTLSESVPAQMRSPWSFMGSLCLHTWILAWVALGPSLRLEKQKSIYEREIQPNEKKIVWYKLTDRLPDVTPPETRHDSRPPRARVKFEQNIASGARDNSRAPQLILAPAPEIALPKPLALPNIVAVAPPQKPLLRPFVPPAVKPLLPAATPALPEAPKVATVEDPKKALDIPLPRPSRKRFTPPTVEKPKLVDPELLPAAPEVASANVAGVSGPAPNVPRKFIPPPRETRAPTGPASIGAPPPTIAATGALPSDVSLVIAGLNPTKAVEVPAPPSSTKGGFSGGPKTQPKGSEGTSQGAGLEIPSLTIQGGARNPQPPIMVARVSPTSPEGLAGAMNAARNGAPPARTPSGKAVKVAEAPDPRMFGRQVYTMALQIPNLTSYSGNWLVWFASHEADITNSTVDIRPPLPVNMVSPRYVPAAMEEKVQGRVRLWAVIGKDGHISGVSLLQHLDDRLDRSAQEALAKWEFQPALRNGVAIEVDAVFEVPFYLTPKTVR